MVTDSSAGPVFVVHGAKGGSGTSVVAAVVGISSARRRPTFLVDPGGDVRVILDAVPTRPDGSTGSSCRGALPLMLPGVDLAQHGDLTLVTVPAASGAGGPVSIDQVIGMLVHEGQPVIVDGGSRVGSVSDELLGRADRVYLVTRPCYLALRNAMQLPKPDGIVLVEEPGRALGARDVEAALGAPVVARLPWDPATARAVDAGLLGRRTPRSLRPLEALL